MVFVAPSRESELDLPTISVLLSIYGGHQYWRSQLESLARQEGVRVQLHYHVDGLDDDPDDLVKEFFPSAYRIPALPGLGIPHAYFALLGFGSEGGFLCLLRPR